MNNKTIIIKNFIEKTYINDTLRSIKYMNDKQQCHRDNDEASCIGYYEDGSIEYQHWYKNGKLHRDNDKPACIIYYKNGSIEYQAWYLMVINMIKKSVIIIML